MANNKDRIKIIDNNFFINPLPFFCFSYVFCQKQKPPKKITAVRLSLHTSDLKIEEGHAIRTLDFASPSFGGFAFFVAFIANPFAMNDKIL